VDPGSADYLISGIAHAEQTGAAAVVITVDTPGGLVTSAREIVQAELNAKVPVIVYVSPSGGRAGSAGVFITMAGHIAAMAPGTTIGAAHPVGLMGGGDQEDDSVMAEKMLQDVVAWARAIAETRGRNVEWAERSVRESSMLTDREAAEQEVVDVIATDISALLAGLHGTQVAMETGPVTLDLDGAVQVPFDMTLTQKIGHVLGDPNLLFAFIALGLLCLYIEFHNPGMIVPGALGLSLLLCAGIGLSILPFNTGGLLLMLLAFALFGIELWMGAFGIAALVGAGALALGGLLLFDVPEFDLGVELRWLISVSGSALLIVLALAFLVGRSALGRVSTGIEAWIGRGAVVLKGGDGRGRVLVNGEDWAASWQGDLPRGTQVVVQKVRGLSLVVEPAQLDSDAEGGA
jgi:membrane-bound serine protease (ClpP class)